ncbi:MAG: RNA 3'-terminal phosphate cyclase [Candidatus Hodarchaeales archaeon]|jgi:RNA 3'-phosphate cyclase
MDDVTLTGSKQNKEFLTIDGSILEGGGSILRLSIAFSAMMEQPVKIINIRKKRSKPGLAAQHLTGLRVMAGLYGLKLGGDHIGSGTVRITSGKKISSIHDAIIKTAGSVSLVFQPVLIAAITNDRKQEILVKGGGTYGKAAPPVDYLKHVYSSILKQLGIKTAIKVFRHGFFPRGGADVTLDVFPATTGEYKSINLTETPIPAWIRGISVASDSLKHANVAERQARAATAYLEKYFPRRVEIKVKDELVKTTCPGSGITLWIENEGGFSSVGASDFGARGKSSEKVGKNAARQLIAEFTSGAAVDSHLADQIIPYMAFIATKSLESRVTVPMITLHARTNVEICKLFIPDLKIKLQKKENNYLIICEK